MLCNSPYILEKFVALQILIGGTSIIETVFEPVLRSFMKNSAHKNAFHHTNGL